ncbi:uncharacterized protein LOC118747237 [Rhagoletis pomonella]|uniref:uncharacterized protein LOC118747237 n=1 Tax=Rhagoletis pomonella TaxID=28610 RepID=UPI00177CC1AB|nr:uncharacterized protein LOC118747237 [Rhagoletis pomonella]
MTTTHIEVTLEQMLQMALGTPKISSINLSILHSLFDILLKKLDCQYEKVEIDRRDGACLQSILRKSRISPLPFNVENVGLISEKLKKLRHLEERHDNLAKQLEEHIEHIRTCNEKHNQTYAKKNWEPFCGACESFCDKPEPQSELHCLLLRDYNFIKKSKQIVEEPLIGPIIDMRKRLKTLHGEVLDYSRRLAEKCERLAYIEVLVKEIEKLSKLIVIEKHLFTEAMQELQDMLDAKIYKVVLPELKRYINIEIEKIQNICKTLKKKSACLKATAFAGQSNSCLSCKGKLTCTQRPILIAPERSVKIEEIKMRKIAQTCSRSGPCLSKEMEKKLLQGLERIEEATEEAKVSREMSKSCHLVTDHFNVFEGTNGVYYRKA